MPEPAAAPRMPTAPQPSPTLAADERIRRRIGGGAPVLHLAFGEAGLPVLPSVRDVLARAATDNAYGPITGSAAAREAAAGYFERRGVGTNADQIVFGPGSKSLLFALLSVLPGDVLLPRPSWVSYAAQAALAGKRVWHVPIADAAGGVPDPDALEAVLTTALGSAGRPGVLVMTLPDNPTGTVAPTATVRRLAEIAAAHGLHIVSDEIYRDLAHDPDSVTSPAEFLPEQTYVTSGLSKNMALGGWRIGFARLADGPAGRDRGRALSGIGSAVWTSLAAPMQQVAAHVLREPPDVRDYIASACRLHRLTTAAVHRVLVAAGVVCRAPAAAFYLYPDFEPLRAQLTTLGVQTGDELAELLLERFDIAVLSGSAFGDEPSALRVRMATSLLYGSTEEQRWQALQSGDPASLPWIHSALDRVGGALAAISAAPRAAGLFPAAPL